MTLPRDTELSESSDKVVILRVFGALRRRRLDSINILLEILGYQKRVIARPK
jgi:hypothetical protein